MYVHLYACCVCVNHAKNKTKERLTALRDLATPYVFLNRDHVMLQSYHIHSHLEQWYTLSMLQPLGHMHFTSSLDKKGRQLTNVQ